MIPIVTPVEMAAIDAAAPEPLDELIARAAAAVAAAAADLLAERYGARRYGRRILAVAGKGNNGTDGRVAADLLRRQGLRADVVDAAGPVPPGLIARADLVIDAAYGTGFRGQYAAPEVGDTPVLAVDIPSGVDGLTGAAADGAVVADRTITFAALKPGLILDPGRRRAGEVTVADIGLDCGRARAWLCQADDLRRSWPAPATTTHKWRRAVWVIGGAPTMVGAPALAVAAAFRSGAGYGAVSSPGLAAAGPPLPTEAVLRPLPATGWADTVAADHGRFGALVVGPGLLPGSATEAEVGSLITATAQVPLVLDGGALDAARAHTAALGGRTVPAVLTPHDGEAARLLGRPVAGDRLAVARELAAELGAVVALKGPTTVAAHPDGRVLVSTAGDERLATAGTGDVLAGTIGAGLAAGLDPLSATGLGAELHGRAARRGRFRGFAAGDLPDLVADWLDDAGEEGR
ncbi:MAG: NAD(P)H-hydrate dehydratase [Actinomycetota bacterium]